MDLKAKVFSPGVNGISVETDVCRYILMKGYILIRYILAYNLDSDKNRLNGTVT